MLDLSECAKGQGLDALRTNSRESDFEDFCSWVDVRKFLISFVDGRIGIDGNLDPLTNRWSMRSLSRYWNRLCEDKD